MHINSAQGQQSIMTKIKKKITSFISAAAIVIASVPVVTADVGNNAAMTVYASEEYSVPNLNIAGKKIPDTESFRFVNEMGACAFGNERCMLV